MSYKTIKISNTDRVMTVSLDRPDVRNAFNPEMIAELTKVFVSVSQRSDIAAVVLRGEGRAFCSGADLNYMKWMARFSYAENAVDSQALYEMFWALRLCPQPVIGRIHGYAMGGALGLIALCDVAAAVEGTKFCFSEVKLGLVPAVISPFVLQKMNKSAARDLMLTGEIFDTQTALQSGLLRYAGTEETVDEFISKRIKAICQNGPEAVRATKNLITTIEAAQDWSIWRDLTTHVIAERRVSVEGQEGLKAFFEKRSPDWKLEAT